MRTAALLLAAVLIGGCTSKNSTETDIDRLVARSVEPTPTTADESIETLRRTNRAIDIALATSAANLSNAKTTGYKTARVHHRGNGQVMITYSMENGSMESTCRQLDAGIQGPGFFIVQITQANGRTTGYTRNGSFFRDRDGDLILNIGTGYRLEPSINIPADVPEENVSIGTDGLVEFIRPGSSIKTAAGQIQLATFTNPESLRLTGGGVFVTDNDVKARVANPGDQGMGTVLSGFLEASNVDINVEELRRMSALRWRDAVDRAIAKADR